MFGSITVVVVNWNAGQQLHSCINSIAKHAHGLVKTTIVVDNGSTDGSDALIESLPNVKLIRVGVNLGFAKACNLGAQLANSDFLLFLNPDAALYSDTLPKVISFMGDLTNAKVGICGLQLMDEDGNLARHCARFPSATSYLATVIGLDRLFPQLGYFMAEWDHAQTRDVDHVIGAFFLVRRNVFTELQGFDERFFVYLEDLDFSYRAYKAGWRTVYLANAQAFHLGGGTSNQIRARRLFYSLRSRLLYVFKHFTKSRALVVALFTLLVEPLSRTGLALAHRSALSIKETWVAYGMLGGWLVRRALKGGAE